MQDINLTFRLSKTPTVGSVLLFLFGCIGPYLPTGFGLWLLDEFGGNMDWGTAILLSVLLLGLIPFTIAAFMIYGIKTKRTSLVTGTVLSAILLLGGFPRCQHLVEFKATARQQQLLECRAHHLRQSPPRYRCGWCQISIF